MTDLAPVLAHLDGDRDQALARLFELLRFRSISTDPAYDGECRAAAEWLARDLAGLCFEARVAPTEGPPMVVAHDLAAEGPHLLFYGHYDVQPVDPLELWDRDPFEPRVITRDDGTKYLSGRGAADDKGQLMTFVEACRAFRAAHGRLPCKITILLEGEEESGGENLPPFLEANRDELTAAIALVCDTGMWNASTPAITTMLRGNVADQVTIHAASRDLHSGMYGSAAANPIHVLTRILADLRDSGGRITIPGFYDGVPEISGDLKAQWERLGFGRRISSAGSASPGPPARPVIRRWSRSGRARRPRSTVSGVAIPGPGSRP